MEYLAGGSIGEQLVAGTIAEPYVAIICREVLCGLRFLHADRKVHRDIKAANILLASDGRVKLADFGVSASLEKSTKRYTIVGTPYWMAPEVIMQAGSDHKADIWSLGITCFEMTYGRPPYCEMPPMAAFHRITRSEPPKLDGPTLSDAYKDFVAQCLVKNPDKRPRAEVLLEHEFIRHAGSVSSLTALIERHQIWAAAHPKHKPPSKPSTPVAKPTPPTATSAADSTSEPDADDDAWDLDTLKPLRTDQAEAHAAAADDVDDDDELTALIDYADTLLLKQLVVPLINRLRKGEERDVRSALKQLRKALADVERCSSGVCGTLFVSCLSRFVQSPSGASDQQQQQQPVSSAHYLMQRWHRTQFSEPGGFFKFGLPTLNQPQPQPDDTSRVS
eukprot:TRINITY_DN9905_c0_g1_i2.p1 TRINITY_DN9905_c0_g1~~TRINITY_DN9905_c0_g1_i2.p1  ORF type:complete len:391 (+),score=146.29 TRINITY_DN9905_c0_g1_i2:441-1613(+)